jgi:hypothetical protein
MTIGNHFGSDYLRHVFKAFWRALERTDTLVVGLLILGGVGSLWFGGHAEHPSWQIALAIFLASLFVLLVKMPYRLYAEQRATIDSLNQRLARISEDRPLRFNDITIEKWIQHSPPYGLWTIERIGLEFENVGDQPLDWRITKLSVEYQNTETAIPLPGDGRYCLHARETTVFAVDVPDLEITLTALGNPTTVRISFCIEYDNVIPLRVRKMQRVTDCNIRNLTRNDYYTNIVDQREW